jgi:hypothetical protein
MIKAKHIQIRDPATIAFYRAFRVCCQCPQSLALVTLVILPLCWCAGIPALFGLYLYLLDIAIAAKNLVSFRISIPAQPRIDGISYFALLFFPFTVYMVNF